MSGWRFKYVPIVNRINGVLATMRQVIHLWLWKFKRHSSLMTARSMLRFFRSGVKKWGRSKLLAMELCFFRNYSSGIFRMCPALLLEYFHLSRTIKMEAT